MKTKTWLSLNGLKWTKWYWKNTLHNHMYHPWRYPLEWRIMWYTEKSIILTFWAFICGTAFTLWYTFVHTQRTRWETAPKFWTYNFAIPTCAICTTVLGSECITIFVFYSIIHASCRLRIYFLKKAVNGKQMGCFKVKHLKLTNAWFCLLWARMKCVWWFHQQK